MTITTKEGLTIELDEYEIRRWFMAAELEQARDTFRVVEGIIETRMEMQPKRARRSDAGTKRSQRDLALDDLKEQANKALSRDFIGEISEMDPHDD